ncbi:hypothetical protein CMO84_01825 [Candidatus Woesearchaeota archaeon]|nr:hypothetical protein [Candidatus Woesearchaeota archaeon]
MPLKGASATDVAVSLRMSLDDGVGTPYVFNNRDSICGMRSPQSITRPATVDYEALLALTEEVRKIKKQRIKKDSAEGLALMTLARRKVLEACNKVRGANSYCSVWKKISRRDGKAVADITAQVKAKMGGK